MPNYKKLVKALRGMDTGDSCPCEYYMMCEDSDCVLVQAADAIEALQAELIRICKQLPKQGEWELIDGAEPMRWGCSRCKYLSWETSNYCPRCGAKMFASDINVLNNNDTTDGPIITPCRGCSDYDGYGGCKSKGGCARAKIEVQDG